MSQARSPISGHVDRIVCAAGPRGSADAVASLRAVAEAADAHAVALVGDLGSDGTGYINVFRALAALELPAYWVPGPGDAPADRYLRDTYNMEVAFPQLHGVHGSAAYTPGEDLLFAGIGGEVSDDPDIAREERDRLRYPRWEPEYRLGLLRLLDYDGLVMLFATPPAHKGRAAPGSDVVAELIGTYRPRLVVTGGERGLQTLGRALVVAPGELADGHYAVANMREKTAELGEVPVAAR